MSLMTPTPGTMLGLAARENRRAQKMAQPRSPIRARLRTIVRALLTTVALAVGLSGFSMASAQAWPWDDMQDNITATIVNICGPNNVPDHATYTNIDTMAGLNQSEPRDGYRSTIKPSFALDEGGTQGGNGMERLQRVYGDQGDVIAKPTYERYGFSSLQWHQYGYDCFSPTLMMGPLANMGLMAMVHVPMMISMAILNFVMDNGLYTAFATLMEPFIGAMYEIFSPWIFFIVPIGVGITWLASRGSLQATLKAAGWGVMILSVYLLMGASTSKVVTWSTNIVTEVSGTAACQMNAAANGGNADSGECDTDDPIKAVQQALWYGIPYQTWHLGQVGEHQAQLDETALESGEVGWGPAILNGQYVGVDENGNVDEVGQQVITETERWNRANYSPDSDAGKVAGWTKHNAWDGVPYLGNIKIMCNDVGEAGNTDRDPSEKTRWMYSGNDGTGNFCDAAGAGTVTMVPHIQGDAYSKQFLVALSGMIGVGAVSLTIVVSSVYLGFQKMMFFFLLFLAPIVLLVSAIGDKKRRPFAVRYAEIVGANLLKQIAAVCIVLFVSYSLASLFGSGTFASVPWIMKPYVALLFFVALAFLAFPLKSMIQGAIKGDTSVVDKQATAPQRALKTGAKVAAVAGAVAATGGIAAAAGAGGVGATALAGAGGKGAALGKAGSMLGQAGRVMGIGSKSGRAMRAGGQLLKAGQGVMESKDTQKGKTAALAQEAQSLIGDSKTGAKYRDKDGNLLPNAQKMAMKDAQKMAEKGQNTDRAAKAQDAHMKAFFNGYRADNGGEFHKMDPQHPENVRKANSEKEVERRRAKEDADATGAKSGSAPGSPDGPDSGGPKGGGGNGTQGSSPTQSYEQFAGKARENLGGPAFAREMEYNVNTVRSGDDVLSNAGLTKDQIVQDPTTLLRSDAYNGGSTTAMDPFHPATASLNELRFASSSGDESAIEGAVEKAVNAISQHGVPSQVDGVHSIGDKATSFEPVQLLGAMPQLSENTTWQERADSAHTMMAAQVAMPQDFPARQSVEEYTSALANPGVDVSALASMKEAAMTEIGNAMSSSMGEAGVAAMAGTFAGTAAGALTSDSDGHAPASYDAPVRDVSAAQPPADPAREETYPPDPANSGHSGPSPEDLRSAVADGIRESRLEHDAADMSGPSHYEAPTSSDPAPANPSPANPAPADESSASATSASAPSSSSASAPTSGLSFTPSDAGVDDDEPVEAVDDSEALIWPSERRGKKKRSGFFDDPDDEGDA